MNSTAFFGSHSDGAVLSVNARAKRSDVVGDDTTKALSSAPSVERMLVFHLAGQRYGLPIDSVQEIQQIVSFCEVPGGGDAIVGMVNLRGVVIPAIDTRGLVGLPREEYHLDTPMIICRIRDDVVALIVDEVEDVVVVPEGCISLPPRLHILSDRMAGVCHIGDDLVFLLDAERLLAPVDLNRE